MLVIGVQLADTVKVRFTVVLLRHAALVHHGG